MMESYQMTKSKQTMMNLQIAAIMGMKTKKTGMSTLISKIFTMIGKIMSTMMNVKMNAIVTRVTKNANITAKNVCLTHSKNF